MNPEIKAQWVADLRSGDYEQGRGSLHLGDRDGESEALCCLGVLCDQAVKAGVVQRYRHPDDGYWMYGEELESMVLPVEVIKWAELPDSNPELAWEEHNSDVLALADLNDAYGLSFSEIADVIEREL